MEFSRKLWERWSSPENFGIDGILPKTLGKMEFS
jgi:hypothetical protein